MSVITSFTKADNISKFPQVGLNISRLFWGNMYFYRWDQHCLKG